MPSEKIVIVEDMQLAAGIMRSSLERLGYVVAQTVSTGEEAVQTVKQCRPDLILMDIHLQGEVDGIEVAQQIRFDSGVPVIFVTGDMDDGLLERSKVAEPAGYLIKPFSIGQLQCTIETGLNYYHSTLRRSLEPKQALKSLLARQTALLAAIPDIIMEVDAHKVYTWANSAGFEFFGDDVIGKEAAAYFEGEQNVYDKVGPLWRGDEDTVYLESWQRRRDGKKRLLAWRCHSLKDYQGKVIGAISSARDITDARLAEDALRQNETALKESKDYLNQIINCIGDPIFAKDRNHRHVLVNEAMCSWTGKRREEMLGKTAHELFPKEEMDPLLEQEKLLFESGKGIITEDQITDRQGSKRTVMTRKSLLSDAQGNKQIVGVVRDITDRKRVETELKESEEKYRMLAEHSLQGVAIIQNGRIVFCNNAYAATTGYSVAELLSLTSTETLVHPDDRALVLRRPEKEEPRHYVLRIVRKDGAERWVESYVAPMEYKGKPALNVADIDITEQKLAEKALQESEKRFRLIAETIDEVFWIDDIENGRMLYISPAHDRIWGYPRQILYENPESFYDPIHPDDRERVAKAFALEKTGQPIECEYQIVRSDGAVRLMWDRGYPIREADGSIKRYVGIAQDVTAWKRAEQALRDSTEYLDQIIDGIGDPVFVKDRQHRFVLVNDAMCAFTRKERQELLGRTAHQLLPKEQADSILKREEFVFETGRESITEEDVTDQQGNTRTAIPRITLLKEKSGEMKIVGIIKDITEHKRLESELRQLQKMEAVGMLAGGIAHDFNNILNVINGYSDLLLDGLDKDDPRHNDLDQIRQAGQRAASLTSQLLSFSRKQMLNPTNMDLNDVIVKLSSMLRRLIGEDIELACTTGQDLGLINADLGQIQQVIMNLVVNARDAMPQGGRLTIETKNVDLDESLDRVHAGMPAGPYVALAISDTGIGMDNNTKTRIFEPFFTTKGPDKGTGLGLSTVYGIVKQSGGFIWVDSEVGKGTTFRVCFPRVEGEGIKPTMDDRKVQEKFGTETVLIAEDEPLVRALASRILRGLGYRILEAANGLEAMRVAEEFAGEIHLVLTDVVMPQMAGSELVSRVKAIRPSIKAVYTSGYTDDTVVRHCTQDLRIPFLQKPYTSEALARKIREAIDS